MKNNFTFRWLLSSGVLLFATSVLAFGQSTPPATTPPQGTTLNLPFKIGLSIGYRWYVGHDAIAPTYTISPNDLTVQRNQDSDWSDVVLSGTIAVFPLNFAKPADGSEQYWNRVGFIANVDIASFSLDKAKSLSAPLSIEGGIGLAYKITDYFALAASIDRSFHRRLHSEFEKMAREITERDAPVVEGKTLTKFLLPVEQRQIKIDGKLITQLDPKDDRLFYDNNRTGLNAKFLYMFP